MSELITAANIDSVIKKNNEIRNEVSGQTMKLQMNPAIMKVASRPQLALLILQGFGLIQMPIEDKFWSGAIFVKNGKIIPVLNTALPRANQYFTAWHEIYHLIYDAVSFSHIIETETIMEERKAEYFASLMLLGNLLPYYTELPEMDFLSKIFHCMDTFSAPYKAVLIALYESAVQNENQKLMSLIKENFDNSFSDLADRFRKLGLDDNLVRPSYVINVGILQAKIQERIKQDPDLNYNYENEQFLSNIIREANLMMEEKNA